MTLTEVCLLTIAVLMIASAGVLIAIVLRLRVTLRMLEELTRDTRESVRRIDDVGAEVQSLVHRANRDYRVVSDAAGLVLNEVVLPVKGVASLIRGVRTGIGMLFHPRNHLSNSTHNERSRT